MRRVFVQNIPYQRLEAAEIKQFLPQLMPAGQAQCVTLHWTAGAYGTGYRDYQILVADDYILVSERLLDFVRHQHTWKRNSGNIGISFMAMANATERNMGRYPLTKNMIERAALVISLLQARYKMAPGAVYDHAYWAKIDGYKGLRWDIRIPLPWEPDDETAFDTVVRKAKWYRSKQAA